MRLWSLHPTYLDKAGLGAVWREGLLAQKVLNGKTKGYKFHSQLERFKQAKLPLKAIALYLNDVWTEANNIRNYNYDRSKIPINILTPKNEKYDDFNFIPVTIGQINYEIRHLQKKLLSRDIGKCIQLTRDKQKNKIKLNSLFLLIDGDIESWEKRRI